LYPVAPAHRAVAVAIVVVIVVVAHHAVPIIINFVARRTVAINGVVIVARHHRRRCHCRPSSSLLLPYPVARHAIAVTIVGNLTVRDDEERRERDGNVGAARGWSDKGQRGIKT
jgi:hypothetical protein